MTLSQIGHWMVPMTCFEELLVQRSKAASRPNRANEPSSSSRALFQDRTDLRDSSRAVTFDPVVDTHIIDQPHNDNNTTGDDAVGDDNTTTTQAVQTEIADGAVRYDLNANDISTDDENDRPRERRATISRHN